MKNKIILLFSFLTAALLAQENKVFDCIDNSLVTIDATEVDKLTDYNLNFLKEKLKDSEIIILGESGHGDGSAFTAKTKMIKFLVNEMGFNTLAFEGANMLEMHQAQIKINENGNVYKEITNSWASIWSQSEQTQELIQFIGENRNKLNLYGIDSQFSGTNYSVQSAKILKDLSSDALKKIDLQSFQTNLFSLYMIFIGDTSYVRSLNKELFKDQLKEIRANLEKSKIMTDKLIVQWSYNIEDFMESLFLFNGKREDEDISIQIRDNRMADNIIWYKKENPKSKIIIWTANFHGCLDLELAQYKINDDWYQQHIPMGEILKKHFGKNLYSLAITSYEGESQKLHSPEIEKFQCPENTFEADLSKNENELIYIDFRRIAEDKYCSDLEFISNIMGLKPGKWFKMYDGVFYIKTMHKAKPMQ